MTEPVIRAVAFDVFGTIAEIGAPARPYRKLLKLAADAGRAPKKSDGADIMSWNLSLKETAQKLGLDPSSPAVAALEAEIDAECASIRLFPDAVACMNVLRKAGYKIALCSNLATPYAEPVKRLLPFEPDFYAWSFEVGAVKPDPAIYRALCNGLGCKPGEVLMVGDTLEADHTGPRRFGINGFHLARTGKSPVAESVTSLDQLLRLPLLRTPSTPKSGRAPSGTTQPGPC